jgi:glyoxylase-like metal-dependent hydrolase (beta-lactamase superfamily II)
MKLVNNLYYYPERGMMDSNVYLIKGKPGVIFDTGLVNYVPSRVAEIKKDGIDPEDIGFIVNTHLHIDHSSGNKTFKVFSGAQIALHPVQKANYQLIVIDGTKLLGTNPVEFQEDLIIENNLLKAGGLEIECIPSPGHSPCSVCYYLRQEKILICGDVLFEMNTGRVDLPGGNPALLGASIENLYKLDIELLLPGHMNGVSGAENVKRNFQYIKQNILPWL